MSDSAAGKAAAPVLIVRSRGRVYATVGVGPAPITFGRAATCDVVLRDDGGVSREHARVWLDELGRVVVADQGSKNGTRVDAGETFRGAARVATRSIRIGEYEIEVTGAPAPGDTQVRFVPDAPGQLADTRFFPPSKRLDLNLQRLTLLMSLTERIGGAFERKQLLEQALDACCEALGFERGLIALKTPRGEPELPVARNIQCDETGAYKVSRTLINQALVHGERAIVNNPATDLVHKLTDSLVRYPICSALCVPILHRDEILGVIYGDRITQASVYTAEDVDFLAAIAQQVGVGLANLRLFQEHLAAQKIYLELEQARAIQRRLLPAAPLRLGRVQVAGYNEPSSAVGGDYFDHFDLGDGRIGVIIADVTGHGLPAALLMANLQAAVRVALTGDMPLPEIAARMNTLVASNTDSDVFITAILGRIDAASGRIEFISAGHPGPILLRGRQAVPLETANALPWGVVAADTYEVHVIEPAALDAVVFFTDGLVEAENAAGELFDLPRLQEALAAAPQRSTDALLSAALDAVRGHADTGAIRDDMTLLAIQLLP